MRTRMSGGVGGAGDKAPAPPRSQGLMREAAERERGDIGRAQPGEVESLRGDPFAQERADRFCVTADGRFSEAPLDGEVAPVAPQQLLHRPVGADAAGGGAAPSPRR